MAVMKFSLADLEINVSLSSNAPQTPIQVATEEVQFQVEFVENLWKIVANGRADVVTPTSNKQSNASFHP